jgi:hypothetical protein
LLTALTDEQKRYMSLFRQVNIIFNDYISIIFCTLVLGIITTGTLVFSLAMFFCYIFSSTIFNYMKLYHRLQQKYKNQSFKPFVGLISSIFIMALYISYFVRREYFGV